jgi:hypothetical protein
MAEAKTQNERHFLNLSGLITALGNRHTEGSLINKAIFGFSATYDERNSGERMLQVEELDSFLKHSYPESMVHPCSPFITQEIIMGKMGKSARDWLTYTQFACQNGEPEIEKRNQIAYKVEEAVEKFFNLLSPSWRNEAKKANVLMTKILLLGADELGAEVFLIYDQVLEKRVKSFLLGGEKYYLVKLLEEKK